MIKTYIGFLFIFIMIIGCTKKKEKKITDHYSNFIGNNSYFLYNKMLNSKWTLGTWSKQKHKTKLQLCMIYLRQHTTWKDLYPDEKKCFIRFKYKGELLVKTLNLKIIRKKYSKSEELYNIISNVCNHPVVLKLLSPTAEDIRICDTWETYEGDRKERRETSKFRVSAIPPVPPVSLKKYYNLIVEKKWADKMNIMVNFSPLTLKECIEHPIYNELKIKVITEKEKIGIDNYFHLH